MAYANSKSPKTISTNDAAYQRTYGEYLAADEAYGSYV